MKNYTATYNTLTMTGVQYSFEAETLEKAQEFCNRKFTEIALKTLVITED